MHPYHHTDKRRSQSLTIGRRREQMGVTPRITGVISFHRRILRHHTAVTREYRYIGTQTETFMSNDAESNILTATLNKNFSCVFTLVTAVVLSMTS